MQSTDEGTSRLPDKSDDLNEPLLQQPVVPVMVSGHAQLPSYDPASAAQGNSQSEEHYTSALMYQPFGEVSGDHTVVEIHEHKR